MQESLKAVRDKAAYWRARLDEGEVSVLEQKQFERWREADISNVRALAEAELLWRALENVPADSSLLSARARAAIEPSCATVEQPSRLWERFSPAWKGLAAVCVLAAFFMLSLQLERDSLLANEVFATLAGQTRDIILPDGTQATLGAGSKLEVSLSDKERRAILHWGTAFFSVEPEAHRPFVVRSGAASVRVLGTAFDLQRREDKLYVQVAEGEVEVALPMQFGQGDTAGEWVRRDGDVLTKRVLYAGEALTASKARGLEAVSSVAIDDIGAWRDGRLVYLQTPISEVISDVNRHVDDPIAVHESIADMTISATFSSQDIEGLLVSLQAVLPVKLSQQDGSRHLVPDESR